MNLENTWLVQKLAQNGFSLQDLSDQSGLSVKELESLAQSERGSSENWDLVLSILNNYPSIRIPSADILNDLTDDLADYPDGQALLYYGISDGAITFCGYQCLDTGEKHGAKLEQDYLSTLQCPLTQAFTLFSRQNAAASA